MTTHEAIARRHSAALLPRLPFGARLPRLRDTHPRALQRRGLSDRRARVCDRKEAHTRPGGSAYKVD